MLRASRFGRVVLQRAALCPTTGSGGSQATVMGAESRSVMHFGTRASEFFVSRLCLLNKRNLR